MAEKETNTQVIRSYTAPLPLSDKIIIWLSDSNKYILVDQFLASIIEKIYHGDTRSSVQKYCTTKLGMSLEESGEVIDLLKTQLAEIDEEKEKHHQSFEKPIPDLPPSFHCSRYYKINGLFFHIEYETSQIEYLIHPKFAHLEVDPGPVPDHHFQLFSFDSKVALFVNGKSIGIWVANEEHYMTGKVSMQILQKIYKNEENDWMAVFHAAGISNGQESIMFLGDSGNGKSTLSAILMSSGYDVLADDFLPVESRTSLICSFPAAISIKKHAVDLLTPRFPELQHAQEFCYPLSNKLIRYLSNHDSARGSPKKVPCKALVFVNYEKNARLQFFPLSKEIAFQKLVPDSWISPLEENAKQFLSWFQKIPCYQLTYSCNKSMLSIVKKIFDDDL